jgi:hypothetical protein
MSLVVPSSFERTVERRALSIQQPWAELILRGTKKIEIRSWSTAFRGPIWIHTGKKGNRYQEIEYQLGDLFHGGYVGKCVIQAVIPLDSRRWELWRDRHLDYGDYRPGFYGFMLTNVVRFEEPLPGGGALKIFRPDGSIAEKLSARKLISPE